MADSFNSPTMSTIKRRHFLQFAGSTFATLALSQFDLISKSNRYAQVLAKDTPRKLALLVGVNNYPNSERFTNLEGCTTDVDLQEQLLIHRFGFHPNDIIKLTSDESADKQPTRKNILTTFEEHLIRQAKPGDVVVFHFSGHGSRFSETSETVRNCRNNELNSTLVPGDDGEGRVTDIMGRTLFLLMSALKTENVTAVLDSCFSGGGTRGNFRIRSVSGDGFSPSREEIEFQKRLMKDLGLSEPELAQKRCQGVAKGVVIASTQKDETAADAPFSGFSAGAFTYLMTQYLWHNSGNVESAMAKISPTLKSYNQYPLGDGNQSQRFYFINQQAIPTDAVITESNGNQVTLWLGGWEGGSLDSFEKGAVLNILDSQGKPAGKVKGVSRDGLFGKAIVEKKELKVAPQAGMLLQEFSRAIPTDLKLHIGIDSSLAGELGDITKALTKIKRIKAVNPGSGNIPYTDEVHYILAKMTAEYHRQFQQEGLTDIPKVGSIGLFTQGFQPLDKALFTEPGETVTKVIENWEAKLKSLVAVHILKKTLNANSSLLDVELAMNLVEQKSQPIARVATVRGANNQRQVRQSKTGNLPLNKLFEFQVTNRTNNGLYITMLLIDSTGDIILIFPYQWPANEESMRLAAGQTMVIGNPKELELKALKKGSGEALLIASRLPLKNAVKTLSALAAERGLRSQPIDLKGEVGAIDDLLSDLSGDRGIKVEKTLNQKSMEVKQMATLSLSFEVG
ncbi:MAG: caspase family protein [Cyanobacteria bacterium J06635_10]